MNRFLLPLFGVLLLLCLVLLAVVFGETLYISQTAVVPATPPALPTMTPTPTPTPKPKPLLAYTFENLKNTQFPVNPITLGPVISENEFSLARKFYYTVPQTPGSAVMQQVSGIMNVPKKKGQFPIIVMFRGYVSEDTYKSGDGTQPAALVFARNGFITLAPDFLGFGESAPASSDPFESRFQSCTTALTLLSSLSALNAGLNDQYGGTITADLTKIGLWGHSYGGQITLAVLAISGLTYPTVLWAPVSVTFPYSILFYTDDFDDHGKSLRRLLAEFEADYDSELFSPPNFYSWIKAPVQIHQGTADESVPSWWSDRLAAMLKKNPVRLDYFVYPGADHNLRPTGWSTAVQRSMTFYTNQFSPK